jgi:hypothetical protein
MQEENTKLAKTNDFSKDKVKNLKASLIAKFRK